MKILKAKTALKQNLSILFGVIAWFGVISQYFISISIREVSLAESTIRFFSYFTLLTNTLIALYFTCLTIKRKATKTKLTDRPGFLTALTVYILIVSLVYHIALRRTWQPKGFQLIVDLCLHTIIPLCALLFWYLFEDKAAISLKTLPKWLIFPLIYWALIMLRGAVSGFFPYPFFNVPELGFPKVLLNAILIMLFITIISLALFGTGKLLESKQKPRTNSNPK